MKRLIVFAFCTLMLYCACQNSMKAAPGESVQREIVPERTRLIKALAELTAQLQRIGALSEESKRARRIFSHFFETCLGVGVGPAAACILGDPQVRPH